MIKNIEMKVKKIHHINYFYNTNAPYKNNDLLLKTPIYVPKSLDKINITYNSIKLCILYRLAIIYHHC